MKISYSIKLGIAAIPVSFFCAYMASCFYNNPPISSADCAAWFGALSTAGAIIGAVFISSSQERHRQHEAMTAARICACGLQFRMAHASAEVRAVLDWFNMAADDQMDPRVFGHLADALEKMPRATPDELLRLGPLPNNCAFKLAAAQDRIFAAISSIRNSTPMPDFARNKGRRDTLKNIVVMALTEASKYINVAVREMGKQGSPAALETPGAMPPQ